MNNNPGGIFLVREQVLKASDFSDLRIKLRPKGPALLMLVDNVLVLPSIPLRIA